MDVVFANRRLRVCVWNPTPNMVSASLGLIETELKRLGTVQLVHLKSLDDQNLLPCDLLVATAIYIDGEHFATWLKGVENRLVKQGGIRVPMMVFAHVDEVTQRQLLRWAVDSNWYFDIIDPEHVASMPIRVANFLRLHDHLHEIQRMDQALKHLGEKVSALEQTLTQNLRESNS